MLDTIVVELEWPHKPFGDAYLFKSKDGDKGPYPKRKRVDGSFPWGVIHLRSIKEGRVIEMQGSPASFLQGHNIFGSNNVIGLVERAYMLAMKKEGIPFRGQELKRAVRRARIRRLDLACSLSLPPGVETEDVLRPLQEALLRTRGAVNLYGKETVLLPRKTAPSMQFYDKQMLLRKSLYKRWVKAKFAGRKYLNAKVEGLLRFEVRFKDGWLKAQGLDVVGKWRVSKARSILDQHLKLAFAQGSVVVKRFPTIYFDFERRLRNVFALWLCGCDLKMHYGKTSRAKYRKELLEHGIELRSRPPGVGESNIEFARLLHDSRRWIGYPKGARKRGLVSIAGG